LNVHFQELKLIITLPAGQGILSNFHLLLHELQRFIFWCSLICKFKSIFLFVAAAIPGHLALQITSRIDGHLCSSTESSLEILLRQLSPNDHQPTLLHLSGSGTSLFTAPY